ncbi:MAG: transposase [Mangrovicoccus sp.]|nr:transposase [Mangrovicoccus sp.]
MAGDEAALYADSAYVGPRTRALLARHGMADRVQRRGAWRHPSSAAARARNAEIGVTRSRIEAIFGHWKRHRGFRRTRFPGLARMRILAGLAAIGWNLWKGARFRSLYG